MDWLGFRYLLLRRFAEAPGKLDEEASRADEPVTGDVAESEPISVTEAG